MADIHEEIDKAIRQAGYEWRSDDDAELIERLPTGQTPYTFGHEIIEQLEDLIEATR